MQKALEQIRQQYVAGEENISVSNSPTSHFLLKRERFMSFKFAHLLFNRENRIDTKAGNLREDYTITEKPRLRPSPVESS